MANPNKIRTIDELEVAVSPLDGTPPSKKRIFFVGECHRGEYTTEDEIHRSTFLDCHGEYLLIPESADYVDFHPKASAMLQLDPLNLEGNYSSAVTWIAFRDIRLFGSSMVFLSTAVINHLISSDWNSVVYPIGLGLASACVSTFRDILLIKSEAEFRDLAVVQGLVSEGVKDILAHSETIVIHAGAYHKKGLIRGLRNSRIASERCKNDIRSSLLPNSALYEDKNIKEEKEIPLGPATSVWRLETHRQLFKCEE